MDRTTSSIMPWEDVGDTIVDFMGCMDGDAIMRSHDDVMGSSTCKIRVDGIYEDIVHNVSNPKLMSMDVWGAAIIRGHNSKKGANNLALHSDLMFGT